VHTPPIILIYIERDEREERETRGERERERKEGAAAPCSWPGLGVQALAQATPWQHQIWCLGQRRLEVAAGHPKEEGEEEGCWAFLKIGGGEGGGGDDLGGGSGCWR